jgi:hypothetical protein
VSASGRQNTRVEELVRQLQELVRSNDRQTIVMESMAKRLESLDRWARSGSNGGGDAKTAEARIQKLENDRASDLRFETRQAQKVTWLIALTAILTSAATAVIVKLIG